MSSANEQYQNVADGASESDMIQIPITELMTALLQRRRLLVMITGLGLLLSVGVSLLLPNVYTSTAQLMPPDAQSLSSTSMLTALAPTMSASSLMGGSSLSRTYGQTIIGILGSRTVLDDIINRLDMRRVYHCKLYVDARKTLAKHSIIEEDKKSGIISISVNDRDPTRAHDIAKAYVEDLDKLISTLSTSSARRERLFLEERLKSIKNELDDSSLKLSQFSSRNATIDYQKQSAATVDAFARLQGELIAAQSELSGLKAIYTDDNMRVRQASARVYELQSQLRKMGGVGERVDDGDLKADQFMPSIRKLPLLGATYADLYRRVTMQETIYEALTKQYELAKVQEAKEIPPIKVLDEPEVPERKSSPHRTIIVLVGGLFSAFAGIAWIIVCWFWRNADDSSTIKAFGIEVSRSIWDHDDVRSKEE